MEVIMKKKSLLIVLALLLALTIVACDNGKEDPAKVTEKPVVTQDSNETEGPTAEPTEEPTPSPEPTPEPEIGENIAVGKPVEVSSATRSAGRWGPEFAVDGVTEYDSSEGNGWTSQVGLYQEDDDFNEYIIVDLEKDYTITAVYLWPRQDPGNEGLYFPVDYTISVSSDKENWEVIATVEDDYGAEDWDTDPRLFYLDEAVTGRYVKVNGSQLTMANATHTVDGPLMQIGEIEIFSKG